MQAEDILREGRLTEAMADLQERVRAAPANVKERIFLFQLLVVQGDWDRALNQLKVLGGMDAGTLAMVQTYREAIRCELLRKRVFAGDLSPLLFGQPEQWMAMLIEALRIMARGNVSESQELREQALDAAPTTAGSIDGAGFEWIADADSRLGPMLEAIVEGRYYWIPFQHISRIVIEEPQDLRDLVWAPAHFQWTNGGQSVGLIPSRYVDSEVSEDDGIRLGRRTEWQQHDAEVYTGLGQRIMATDADEYPMLEVREIVLDTLVDDPDMPGSSDASEKADG